MMGGKSLRSKLLNYWVSGISLIFLLSFRLTYYLDRTKLNHGLANPGISQSLRTCSCSEGGAG
jgi:hypothetical protein